MILVDIPQGTPEWLAARCGIPSASCFDKIVTSTGEPSKTRIKYLYQLAGERLTGCKEESYQNQAMTRGIEMEAEARHLYEMLTEETVEPGGLCYKDEQKIACCSPDGLIGKNGGLEIKCPTLAVHIGYLIENKLPTEYFQQVQGGLYITGREYWAFMSYFPGIRPLIVRVERDEKFIAKLDAEIKRFSVELDEITEKIRG